LTPRLILDLIAAGCWAKCQLRGGIRYIFFTSKLMNSPTLHRVAFRQVPELDGRFLYNAWAHSRYDCGGLLGSMPTT